MLKKTKAILLSLLLLCFASLSACFDVGDVKDEAEYCEVFSQVILITQVTTESYGMDEFYNEDTVNDLVSPARADKYFYFCVKMGDDFTGGDMGLHCKLESGTGSIVNVEGFILNEEEYTSVINHSMKQITFPKNSFDSATVNLTNPSAWASFTLDGIGKVNEGCYIVLRFNEVASGQCNFNFLITAPVIRVNERG